MATTDIDNMSVEELQAALEVAKERKREKERIEREERRARERAEFIARVDEVRENTADEFVGDHSEWISVNAGYNGSLELAIYEGTSCMSSIHLEAKHVAKLKEIMEAL